MKKKQGILAVAFLVAILATGAWAFHRPEKPIDVKGNVSAQDVSDIKQAVKRAMWKEVFPGLSWSNLKASPSRLRWYFRHEVQFIAVYEPNLALAIVAEYPGTNAVSKEGYNVEKGTNGWKAHHVTGIID